MRRWRPFLVQLSTFVAAAAGAYSGFAEWKPGVLGGSVVAATIVLGNFLVDYFQTLRRDDEVAVWLTKMCASWLSEMARLAEPESNEAAGGRVVAFLPLLKSVEEGKKEVVMVPRRWATVNDSVKDEPPETVCMFRKGEFPIGAFWHTAVEQDVRIAGCDVKSLAQLHNDEAKWIKYWRTEYETPDRVLHSMWKFSRQVESLVMIYVNFIDTDSFGRRRQFECILAVEWKRPGLTDAIAARYGGLANLALLVEACARAAFAVTPTIRLARPSDRAPISNATQVRMPKVGAADAAVRVTELDEQQNRPAFLPPPLDSMRGIPGSVNRGPPSVSSNPPGPVSSNPQEPSQVIPRSRTIALFRFRLHRRPRGVGPKS